MKSKIITKAFFGVTLVFATICLAVLAINIMFKQTSNTPTAFALSSEEVTNLFTVGQFKSGDNAHTIEVTTDGNILYDNTYTLHANESGSRYTLSGNIGTSGTSVTFLQLNKSAVISLSHVNYVIDENTYSLSYYTPFVNSSAQSLQDASGAIEVWANGNKTATFADFQSAFNFASSGNTIKVNRNFTITEGTALAHKNLTIDGNNYILDNSTNLSTVFAVADNATLTIKNLSINCGATHWATDFNAIVFGETFTIPLVEGSTDSEPVTTQPVITSTGKLITDNINISNIYAPSVSGGAITISKGQAEISNSTFNHNFSGNGGSMRIGYGILDEAPTDFPVTKVQIKSTNFTNGRAHGGGAIMATNVGELDIEDCNFDTNVSPYNNNGGAIYFTRTGGDENYNSDAHRLGLDFPQVKINRSTFNNNWAGNDAFAIINYDAEFTITNTNFTNNAGVHTSSSVGTIVHCVDRQGIFPVEIFDNCTFEGNRGAISCIGDFGSWVDIRVLNCYFTGNEAFSSLLLYTALAKFDNCIFENEKVKNAVIRIPSIQDDPEVYEWSEGKTPMVTLKDVTITGSTGLDIRATVYGNDPNRVTPEITIEGTTTADIKLQHNSKLYLNGTLDGDVVLDEKSPAGECVVMGSNGVLNGKIGQYVDLVVKYTNLSDQDASTTISILYKTVTSSHKIENLLGVSKNGYTLNIYTDTSYTENWDYVCDTSTTVYARWEEHDHAYTRFVADGAVIYKECSCGADNGSIAMSLASNLVYDGTNKQPIITDTLGISQADYQLTYAVKNASDAWIGINAPINAGSYRATLTYQGASAEIEFVIQKATLDLSGITFNNKTVNYNGQEQKIEISGSLPAGVSVSYSNNKFTEVGEYLVTATFNVDESNYNKVESMSAILKIVDPTLTTGSDSSDVLGDINWVQCGISAGAGALVMLLFVLTFGSVSGKGRHKKVKAKYYYDTNPNNVLDDDNSNE